MPTLEKCGYTGKQLIDFITFAKRKFKADLRAALLDQDIKAQIDIDEANKSGALTLLVTETKRAPSFKRGFRILLTVDGSTFRDFEYEGPIPKPAKFMDVVATKALKTVSMEHITYLIRENCTKNQHAEMEYKAELNEIEMFNYRIAAALTKFWPRVFEVFTEFERVQ